MNLSDYITKYRAEHALSQRQFAAKCELSNGFISMLEKGINPNTRQRLKPSLSVYQKLAHGMGMSVSDLFASIDDMPVELTDGQTSEPVPIPPGFEPMPEMVQVPRVGRIACGTPILAEENVEQVDTIPAYLHADYTLRCVGDSMAPKFLDGDVVCIRTQPEVENGEVAAVLIGEEATLKQVFLHEDFIELRPINPEYRSIIRVKEAMNDVTIEGKAVGLVRAV